jgi:hypothetical protein
MKPLIYIAILTICTSSVTNAAVSTETTDLKLQEVLDSPAPPIHPASNSSRPQPSRGQLLYENQCTECHASQVHIRNYHKAENINAIRKWVEHWSQQLHLQWTSVEVEDVVIYLNQTFYNYTE